MRRDDPMLTRAQVTQHLSISLTTLKRLVAAGKLRETRIPSARGERSLPRYRRSSVDAYLASGYVTAPIAQTSTPR